jgi:hypothetical protein
MFKRFNIQFNEFVLFTFSVHLFLCSSVYLF